MANKPIFKYELGETVKDIFSEFVGVIFSRMECITGQKKYGVQAEELDNGKIRELEWLEEPRIEKSKGNVKPVIKLITYEED